MLKVKLVGSDYDLKKIKMSRFNYRRNLISLFDLMQDDEDQMLFSVKCVNNNYERFELFLKTNFQNYYHEFFVVEDETEFGLKGCLYSYDYHPQDGWLKICVVANKKYRGTGFGAQATIEFMDYLFRNYPLRKIYSPTFSYNNSSIEGQKSAGMVEEGRYKEYRYYDGKYHDLVILSISREDFYKRYSKMLYESK